jgi:hypothetical protein
METRLPSFSFLANWCRAGDPAPLPLSSGLVFPPPAPVMLRIPFKSRLKAAFLFTRHEKLWKQGFQVFRSSQADIPSQYSLMHSAIKDEN